MRWHSNTTWTLAPHARLIVELLHAILIVQALNFTPCAAGALLGMVSSCYVALYGQARILCVVARDHMLPPVLARISPRLGTPAIAATVMGLATGLNPVWA
jgi:amino acid transporter